MKFYDAGLGKTRADYVVSEAFQGYPGIVHGGVIAAMLDEAAGRTVMGAEDTRRVVVTGRMDIRYRRPVPTSQPLVITGELMEDNGSVVKATGKIFDARDTLLAEALVTLVEIPNETKAQIKRDPEDWKVYPDVEGFN